jgi:polyadenylate-binding protein
VVEQSNNSSKGFGFVKFADSHCAAEAVELMNGALIEGEMISVRVASLSPHYPAQFHSIHHTQKQMPLLKSISVDCTSPTFHSPCQLTSLLVFSCPSVRLTGW